MKIEYPWLLLLILPYLAVLFFFWRTREPAVHVPWLRPFRIAAGGSARLNWKKIIPFLFFALSGVFLILALTRPYLGLEQVRTKTEGIDIILAVDLSGSMLAFDAPRNAPDLEITAMRKNKTLFNRLETSKREIEKFVRKRPNDKIGLIAFGELPIVLCPPTLDHGFLLENLKRLEPNEVLGTGTGIAAPISSAVRRLKNSESKSKVIVLFTDGANTVNAAITPQNAGSLAKTFDITIYTVGIGSPFAKMEVQTFFGVTTYQPYPNQFDEGLLKELANNTGGRYYKAEDAKAMENAMEKINLLEKTSIEQPIIINRQEWYPILATIALLLMLLGFLAKETFCCKLP